MLLGLATKDAVMDEARQTHQIRENVITAYKDYLKLSNNNLQAFLRTVIPQLTFSNAFDYETFKNDLRNGSFGDVFYYQSSPVPLACPQIKNMCEDLVQKIANINSFKATEEQQHKKLSSNLKENLKIQCEKWKSNKISHPSISYMEVQLDTLKQLKNEAVKLATRVDWTESSFGVSSSDLDEIIIDLNEKLTEGRRSERQNESKTKKISDQISSRGPVQHCHFRRLHLLQIFFNGSRCLRR